jgi:hypothetical protein
VSAVTGVSSSILVRGMPFDRATGDKEISAQCRAGMNDWPGETQSPLIVDSDRTFARKFVFQNFEPDAGRC